MTTIVYRQGVLAADTRMIQGTAIIGDFVKIVRREDGALCGGAGDAAVVQAFQRWFLDGEEGDPPVEENTKALILRRRKPIELFECSGAIEWRPPYVAIGSGKEFALGAMFRGATAVQAVKAAMHFDPGTGGEVMVLRHDKA
jgi:20S proteasome alpha/beta subunit